MNSGSDSEAKDFTSLFLSFPNILSAHLSTLDWLGSTWKTYDNNKILDPNFFPGVNCPRTYDHNADLASPIPILMDNGTGLGGAGAGVTSIREYASGPAGESQYSDESAASYRADGLDVPVMPQHITLDGQPHRAFDIFQSNAAHFAHALNEHLLVAVVDLNGMTTYANEKFCAVFKYTSQEMLGQHYRVINSECHTDAFFSELWRTITQGKTWKGDLRNRAKDGAMHWLDAIVIPCFDRTGKIYQYIAICTDITVRKTNEEALCASRNELRALANHLGNAQDCERKRIAREIHDELGQHLLALKLDVCSLHASTVGRHPKLNAKIQFVLQGIDETMRQVKSIITDLRPAALEFGLADAIQSHVHAFERRSGIPCELLISDENIELDSDTVTVLFRVLQESLVNISRHAKASRACIALYRNADCVLIEVSDNGKGIDVNGHDKRHSFGLLGMRERIEAMGGVFSIEPAAGGGTTLIASVPL